MGQLDFRHGRPLDTGQRTQTGRSTTQIGALRKVPCPRFDDLDDAALDDALASFKDLRSTPLLPACQAHADKARKAIDRAVVRFLGLPKSAESFASDLRILWCSEPSVHGHNQRAMAKLKEA